MSRPPRPTAIRRLDSGACARHTDDCTTASTSAFTRAPPARMVAQRHGGHCRCRPRWDPVLNRFLLSARVSHHHNQRSEWREGSARCQWKERAGILPRRRRMTGGCVPRRSSPPNTSRSRAPAPRPSRMRVVAKTSTSGSVSLALVALALVGQASALETASFLFGLVLIPILIPRNGTSGTGAGTTGIAVIAAETGGHPLRQKRHYRLLVASFENLVPLPYRLSVTRSPAVPGLASCVRALDDVR